MSEQLNEVFDSEGTLPVVNLNPKLKVPQIWKIGGVESNLVARMVSYTSEGDAIKQVKMGDKYAHVILMSLSAKGTPAELKGGLGASPIDAINSIFDVVYDQVKKLRMDAVMFRFPTKKMKGQGPVVQRVIQRLVMQKAGGRFKVVPSMYQFTGKHTYILVVRKNSDIEDIAGMPGINPDLYTRVDSDVGEVYISKKDGIQVGKEVAIAGSIAAVEEKRTDIAAIRKTKISRRAIAASQSLETYRQEGELFQKYEDTAAELSKPATAEEGEIAKELKAINSAAVKGSTVDFAVRDSVAMAYGIINGFTKDNPEFAKVLRIDVEQKMVKALRNISPNSVDSLKAYAEIVNEVFMKFKRGYFMKKRQEFSHLDNEARDEMLEKQFNIARTRELKKTMKAYANHVGNTSYFACMNYNPKQYSSSEKASIRDYCASGYSDINNMLLGRYHEDNRDILDEAEVKKDIAGLDSAFSKGDRLPEGVTLYRAQTIRAPIYEALVKNKVFYFRNFVSTSLYPIIFGGWKGSAAIGMLPDSDRKDYTVDKKDEEIVINPSEIRAYANDPLSVKVTVGWTISDAHKINVIIPGELSNMTQEQEVILPRGLMLKVDKITDASHNDGMTYSNNKLIEASVMTSDQMNEGVVYDGDVLLESGELVELGMDEADPQPVDFSSFVKSTHVGGLSVLAGLIDLENTPEKFIQG